MSRMAERRVYFEMKLPMFVLLVPLLLAKCVSGDGLLTAAESSHAGFAGKSGTFHNAEITHSRRARAAAQPLLTQTAYIMGTPSSKISNTTNAEASVTNPTTKNSPAVTEATTSPVNASMTNSTAATITSNPPEINKASSPPAAATTINSSAADINTNSSAVNIATNPPPATEASAPPSPAVVTNSPAATITTNPPAITEEPTPPVAATTANPSTVNNLSTTNTTNIHPGAAISNETILDTSTTAMPSTPHSSRVTGVTSSPSIATKPDSVTSSDAMKSTRADQHKSTNGIPTNENAHSTTSKYPSEFPMTPQGNVSSPTFEGDITTPTQSSGNNSISSVPAAKLGDPCDGKCEAANSICGLVGDKNICTCEDGLTASVDGNFCYGKALMYLDPCNHNENCTDLGPNVECKNFSCVCKENYIRRQMTCMEKIDRLDVRCNGETQVCYMDEEGDSIKRQCLGGFCRCDSANGFVPHNGLCKKKISLLGAPCEASTHVCHLDGDGDNQTLHCQNGICQCKDTFLMDNRTCKKKIDSLGEKCSPDAEICHAEDEGYHRRKCSEGTCQCRSAFVRENGMCKQKISLLGAPCIATSEVCFLQEDGDQQKIHCKDGVCQCKAEFALRDKICQKEKSRGGVTQNLGPSAWILLTLVTAEILW